MGILRLGGTLVALLSGGAVVVGGATAAPVAVAVATGAGVAATVAYALGDRRYPLAVAVSLYLAAGAAVLSEAIAAPTLVAAPLFGVGGLLAVAFLVRARLGNARRVATLPVDPGSLRRREAGVARRVLAVQSAVGRVAATGVGSARLGAVALVVAWAGAVAGATAVWAELPRPAGLVGETAALLGLALPFYWGTDWRGLDAPDGPEPASLGSRLAAVGAAFHRDPTARTDEPEADAAATPEVPTGDRTAGDGSGAVASGTDAGGPADPTVSAGEGSPGDDDEVAELPTAEEMGPASWGTGDDDADESGPGGTADGSEADDGGDASGEEPLELPPATSGDESTVSDPDDGTLPGVPEVGDAGDGESAFDLDVGGADEADDEDDEDDVLTILEDRDDPTSIDGDASPAREAFGIYERVSEILGNDASDADDWRAEGGDEDSDAEDEGNPDGT